MTSPNQRISRLGALLGLIILPLMLQGCMTDRATRLFGAQVRLVEPDISEVVCDRSQNPVAFIISFEDAREFDTYYIYARVDLDQKNIGLFAAADEDISKYSPQTKSLHFDKFVSNPEKLIKKYETAKKVAISVNGREWGDVNSPLIILRTSEPKRIEGIKPIEFQWRTKPFGEFAEKRILVLPDHVIYPWPRAVHYGRVAEGCVFTPFAIATDIVLAPFVILILAAK